MKFNKYTISALVFMTVVLECCWAYSADFKRPCRDLSPDCMKQTFQAAIPIFAKGVPELGLERLDPYHIKQLNLSLSGGITIQVMEGEAKGLKSCIVDFASFAGDTLESQIHCNLTMRGKYKSSGHLLLFPVDGEGDSTIKCRNIKIHSFLKLGTKLKADGHKYLFIKNSDISTTYDGRVSFEMTNLFRGNPEISKSLIEFMNSNWRMVAEEFGGPMVDFGVKSVMKNIKRMYDVLSIDELKKL